MMKLLVPSLILGASAHGWMTRPVANQPEAAGYDLDVEKSDPSAWATIGTTCQDNSPNNNPFNCPGEADIQSSCGVWWFGCGNSGKSNPWGKKGGNFWCDGRRYLGSRGQTTWEAGSVVEVAWTITANHQGAIGYRLCPRSQVGQDSGNDGATEKCFQANHLKYATNETCIQCPTNGTTTARKCFAATDHVGKNGNAYRETVAHLCKGHQQADFCNGKMDYPCFDHRHVELHDGPEGSFSLVDKVIVPDLPEGDYVLSWRWDCQDTPQVWTNCADIKISPSTGSVVI